MHALIGEHLAKRASAIAKRRGEVAKTTVRLVEVCDNVGKLAPVESLVTQLVDRKSTAAVWSPLDLNFTKELLKFFVGQIAECNKCVAACGDEVVKVTEFLTLKASLDTYAGKVNTGYRQAYVKFLVERLTSTTNNFQDWVSKDNNDRESIGKTAGLVWKAFEKELEELSEWWSTSMSLPGNCEDASLVWANRLDIVVAFKKGFDAFVGCHNGDKTVDEYEEDISDLEGFATFLSTFNTDNVAFTGVSDAVPDWWLGSSERDSVQRCIINCQTMLKAMMVEEIVSAYSTPLGRASAKMLTSVLSEQSPTRLGEGIDQKRLPRVNDEDREDLMELATTTTLWYKLGMKLFTVNDTISLVSAVEEDAVDSCDINPRVAMLLGPVASQFAFRVGPQVLGIVWDLLQILVLTQLAQVPIFTRPDLARLDPT